METLPSPSIILSAVAVDGVVTVFDANSFPAMTLMDENIDAVPTLLPSLRVLPEDVDILSADALYVATRVRSALDPHTSLFHHYLFADILTLTTLPTIAPTSSFSDIVEPTSSSIPLDGSCRYGKKCADGLCCSEDYYCGSTLDYCGIGCRPELGSCDAISSSIIASSTTWPTTALYSPTPIPCITIYTTEYIQVCPVTRPCHGGLETKTYTITDSYDHEKGYVKPLIPPHFTVTTTVCHVCEGEPTITVTYRIEYARGRITKSRHGNYDKPVQTGKPSDDAGKGIWDGKKPQQYGKSSQGGVAVNGSSGGGNGGARENYLQTNAATKAMLAEMLMIGVIAVILGVFVSAI